MGAMIVFLNGSFMPESEAKVSVLDGSFNAGFDDITRTFGPKPFRLRDHTARLSYHQTPVITLPQLKM